MTQTLDEEQRGDAWRAMVREGAKAVQAQALEEAIGHLKAIMASGHDGPAWLAAADFVKRMEAITTGKEPSVPQDSGRNPSPYTYEGYTGRPITPNVCSDLGTYFHGVADSWRGACSCGQWAHWETTWNYDFKNRMENAWKAHVGAKGQPNATDKPEYYTPSNSSEGDDFQSSWCEQCRAEADGASCELLTEAMATGGVEQWQMQGGKPVCTAFERVERQP